MPVSGVRWRDGSDIALPSPGCENHVLDNQIGLSHSTGSCAKRTELPKFGPTPEHVVEHRCHGIKILTGVCNADPRTGSRLLLDSEIVGIVVRRRPCSGAILFVRADGRFRARTCPALEPSPPAMTTAAMPPANPAASAWRRSTPTRSSPARPMGRAPLHLGHKAGRLARRAGIRRNRHRLCVLDQANADHADGCDGDSALCKAKESTAGGSAHRACSCFFYAALRANRIA